ncbi:uncharacterized protein [Macrobrachium rosenbergii]|uniref:uncharacterized protein n=1 Tax=Macrobrachium rosenbergii TaxID=79674 RepID=UPI0034D72D4A
MKCLLSFLLLPVVVWGYCDPEFTRVGEQCLSFVTQYHLTFEEASEYCNEMRGASLVTIDSARQFKTLVDYIYASDLAISSYWVDGNDKETEGVWISSSGNKFPMGTPFWVGYPTFQEPNGIRRENCAHLYDSAKFYINDSPCNRTNPFICEQADVPPTRKIQYEPPKVTSCPMHYVEVGGKCLSFMTYEADSWESAKLRCRDKEGNLAIVDDIELLREINLYLQAEGLTDHDFWLGASDAQAEGQWLWTDGSAVPMGKISLFFFFWCRDRVVQGKKWSHTENSSVYFTNYRSQEPDGGVNENHLALLSKGYFYFRDANGTILFHPLCQLTGGDLAIVDDIELLREINLYLQAKGLTDQDFWLGASDAQAEGQWLWTDGSAVPMGTPFWGLSLDYSQEPDGGVGENHLALLSKGYFYFRDADGTILFHPLCQLTG